MARSKSDSWTMAGRSPDSCIKRPASFASCTPRSLSGTSCQPVNRFSRFQVLSPCRSRTRVPGFSAVAIDLGRDLDDVRELVGDKARASNEHAVEQRQLHVLLHLVGLPAAALRHS